jgi:hypothetical protein
MFKSTSDITNLSKSSANKNKTLRETRFCTEKQRKEQKGIYK